MMTYFQNSFFAITHQFQLIVLLLIIVVGIGLFVFQSAHSLKRNNQLTHFGINTNNISNSMYHRLIRNITDSAVQITQSNESEMKAKLIAAGIYNTQLAGFVTPLKYIVFVIGAIAFYGLYGKHQSMLISAIAILIWFILTTIAPDIYLSVRKKKLQKKLSGLLPYVADLLAICVQSGMTIEAAIRYLSNEVAAFDKDLSYMLKRLNDNAKVLGMAEALDGLYQYMPTPEFRSFVMTLKQSLRYGASIYKILVTLAADIRDEQMLVMEEKIGKLGSKMSIPLILLVMMPVVILIAAPGVMRLMS